mmetsp:Transcript_49114/g.153785  ORF Transcript_49114/g.153785 Transcript_49114/m.153785 type:complete len:286 (+) Transcript_49114:2865-3722(+)
MQRVLVEPRRALQDAAVGPCTLLPGLLSLGIAGHGNRPFRQELIRSAGTPAAQVGVCALNLLPRLLGPRFVLAASWLRVRPRAEEETAAVGFVTGGDDGGLQGRNLRLPAAGPPEADGGREQGLIGGSGGCAHELEQQPLCLIRAVLCWHLCFKSPRLGCGCPAPQLSHISLVRSVPGRCVFAHQDCRNIPKQLDSKIPLRPRQIHTARSPSDSHEGLCQEQNNHGCGDPLQVHGHFKQLSEEKLQPCPSVRVALPLSDTEEALADDTVNEGCASALCSLAVVHG